MSCYIETYGGMIDQEIGYLVEIRVHRRQDVSLSIFELKRCKGNLAFDRLCFAMHLHIAVHEKQLLNPEEVIALNDEEVVAFINQLKIERPILAQVARRDLDAFVHVDH